MKLTVLGKYGIYPPPKSANVSYHINSLGVNILIDMGSGSLSRLIELGLADSLNAIIISHLHADHMSDLLVMKYYATSILKRDKSNPINVYIPMTPSTERSLVECEAFKIITLKSGAYDINGVKVEAHLMTHPIESYAIKIVGDKTLIYTGDTTMNDNLPNVLIGSDACIADTCMIKELWTPNSSHIAVKQMAQLAQNAGCTLYLSHFLYKLEDLIYNEAKKFCDKIVFTEEYATYEI